MKIWHIVLALGILFCMTSCSKDEHEPYRPSEWSYDRYSDTDILPGDDFYRFVCGKGIVNHIDDWYRLFEVTPERKFYLAPERRVYLW